MLSVLFRLATPCNNARKAIAFAWRRTLGDTQALNELNKRDPEAWEYKVHGCRMHGTADEPGVDSPARAN